MRHELSGEIDFFLKFDWNQTNSLQFGGVKKYHRGNDFQQILSQILIYIKRSTIKSEDAIYLSQH